MKVHVEVDMTPEEAFKVVLSTGNYLPPLMPAPQKLPWEQR